MIVDDTLLVRVGVAQVIEETGEYEVCGEASSVQEAIAEVDEKCPDLVLVDLSLRNSNGLDLIRELRESKPSIPTLVVSMHDEPVYVEQAFRAGASGYLLKRESTQKVGPAIEAVFQGRTYVSESVSSSLADSLRSQPGETEVDPVEVLSRREYEVFRFLGQGFSRREAAQKLGLSAKTIESHVDRIRAKLMLDSGQRVIHAAIRHCSAYLPE